MLTSRAEDVFNVLDVHIRTCPVLDSLGGRPGVVGLRSFSATEIFKGQFIAYQGTMGSLGGP